VPGRFVTRGGVRLHVLERGDGADDLLVLPGITSPAAVWEFAVERLAERRRVHTMDLRGRGLSDKPQRGYSLDDYAADVAAVVRQLRLRRPAVLGHSLGARILAALAFRGYVQLGTLILVDPPVTGPGRAPYPYPLDFYLDGIEAASGPSPAEATGPPHWTDRQRRERAVWLATCSPDAVRETYANFHAEDFLGLWRRLAGPALICGGDSEVVPPAALEELRRLNPSAWVRTVPAAGHMVPWDNLAGFHEAVEEALSRRLDPN
jgi:N-formylmaleamate deformylase